MQYLACLPLFFETFCSHHGMDWDRSCSVEGRIFLKACLSPLWDPSWSLQTISSIMLYRFSTGLISGEFECQLAFRLKLSRFFLHHAWLALIAWAGMPHFVVCRLELHSFHLSCASVTILRQRRDIKRVHLQNRRWKSACEIWPTKLGDCLAGSRPKHSLLTGKAEFQHLSQTKGHNKINVM